MKRVYIGLVMLAVTAVLAVSTAPITYAGDLETDVTGLKDSVPDSAKDIVGELKPDTAIDAGGALESIVRKVFSGGEEIVKSAMKNGVTVLAAAVFCSLAGVLFHENGGKPDYVLIAGVLAITTVSVSGVSSIIGSASEMMNELYSFSNALLPTLASASVATGSVTGAAAKLAASTLFMDVLISLGQNVIMPLIYAFIAVSAASAVFGGVIKSVAKLIKWAVNTLLIAAVTSFTVYLTVTGIISSTADAATVKITKTAISTLLPVVGKLVSDAADSVASGFSVLKNAAGVFGILVICAVCAGPFLRLIANFFVFKAASALAEPVAGSGLAGLISDVGTALGLAMASAGSCAAILYISVVSVIKVVTVT